MSTSTERQSKWRRVSGFELNASLISCSQLANSPSASNMLSQDSVDVQDTDGRGQWAESRLLGDKITPIAAGDEQMAAFLQAPS